MVGQSQLTIADWAYPEVLFGFLDELREDGYNLGTSHYGAAQDLLLALAAESGSSGVSSRRFTRLLGPLLCSTPREQEEFPNLVARWSDGLGQSLAEACRERERAGAPAEVARATPAPVNSPTELPRSRRLAGILERIERGFRTWRWIVAIAMAVLLAGVLLLSPRRVSRQAALPPQLSRDSITALPPFGWVLAVVGAFAVAYLGWRLWLGLVARQFLARRTSTEPPALQRLTIVAEDSELFAERPFQGVAQQLRRRISVPGRELDLEATVEQTARRGGWPVPVAGRRLVRPEYLALIERAAPGDQRTRLADDLSERLAGQGILLERAYFDTDPRTCFRLGPATAGGPAALTPLSLRELYSRYPEHRLLLITGGEGLFSPTSGELVSWIDQLLDWEHRAVLTPRPVEQWGRRERDLAQHFTVLPATLDGMAQLTGAFEERGARSIRAPGETDLATAGGPLPDELRTRPQRWLGRNAPETWLVEEVLDGLALYLGEAGFYWLAACAVYPELNWNLTLSLGKVLTTEKCEPLLDSRRLATLIELPWFRHGAMPDWLRRRLLSRLSRQKEAQVRAAIEAALLTALDERGATRGGAFAIAVAGVHRGTLERLWKPVWRNLVRQSRSERAIQDYVFSEFMSARKHRLAVALPAPLARLLQRMRPAARLVGNLSSPTLRRARLVLKVLLVVTPFAFFFQQMQEPGPLRLLLRSMGVTLGAAAYIWRSARLLAIGLYWSGVCIVISLLFLDRPFDAQLSMRLMLAVIIIGLLIGNRIGDFDYVNREIRSKRAWHLSSVASISLLFCSISFLAWGSASFGAVRFLYFSIAFPLGLSLMGLGYVERSYWLAAAGGFTLGPIVAGTIEGFLPSSLANSDLMAALYMLISSLGCALLSRKAFRARAGLGASPRRPLLYKLTHLLRRSEISS